MGLAVHIQSLPGGAKISIKALAERFPESETRIAAALRELEAHGYLHRSRVRLANGRIATRTMSFNQPNVVVPTGAVTEPQTRRGKPAALPAVPSPPREPAPAPRRSPLRPRHPYTYLSPLPRHPPRLRTGPHRPQDTAPPLPQPQTGNPELHRKPPPPRRPTPPRTPAPPPRTTSTPHPGVVTWLERNTTPTRSAALSPPTCPSPEAPGELLRHRIATLLPPRSPVPTTSRPCTTSPPPSRSRVRRLRPPFHSRNNHPTRCRDCRDDLQTAA
ncbi:helix-turn-helix domain-containing protein [Streptomyces sp. M10(2022)]